MPTGKLVRRIPAGTQPVVLLSCGSFNPPTYLHLRIFEEARITLRTLNKFVIGGFISPTHDKYFKKSLCPMVHRVAMSRLAVQDSDWIDVSDWETMQPEWTRTALSLKYMFQSLQLIEIAVGDEPPRAGLIKVMLLCGGDVLATFGDSHPNGDPVWLPEDRFTILRDNGIACIQRAGTDLAFVIDSLAVLKENAANITIVAPLVENTISSTIVRKCLQQDQSVKYLTPDSVIEYMKVHKLRDLPAWKL